MIISPYCDILGFRFWGKCKADFDMHFVLSFINWLKNLDIAKQMLFIGAGDDEQDRIFLPELIKNLSFKDCIIANVNERTYSDIIPLVIQKDYYVVLKTPIDINLAKELNIACIEMGLPHEKIIMNTDIGGLGYGYEYGYSMIEKIKNECKDDLYLNFPIFSDASGEALKTKEAKSADLDNSWGEVSVRSKMIELAACGGVLSAGADIITVHHQENIKVLKGLV